MPVLVIADVHGQTREKYDRMLDALRPALEQAPGFIAHGAGASADGWLTFEVWASSAQATQFFAKYIVPNLPDDVKPKRTLVELHSLVMPLVHAGP